MTRIVIMATELAGRGGGSLGGQDIKVIRWSQTTAQELRFYIFEIPKPPFHNSFSRDVHDKLGNVKDVKLNFQP